MLDSGQPAKILDFYSGDSPISLAILLDISGSMAVGGNMDRAREAVTVATMSLRTPDDEAALFTFDSELQQVVGFTKDLERIRRVSLKGTPWGKTSLYDAIADTATAVSERANQPSRTAGHHRWRRYWQQAARRLKSPVSRAPSTCRFTC